jgi:hypothetical protein
MVTIEEETMIELRNNCLNFGFPGVHDEASCSIDFQRTLRIPDDNKPYALPPGLGRFPVKHIDDYAPKLPEDWVTHGGVFIPMYQSEALWINFHGSYPCAVKIAAGKINALMDPPGRSSYQKGNRTMSLYLNSHGLMVLMLQKILSDSS